MCLIMSYFLLVCRKSPHIITKLDLQTTEDFCSVDENYEPFCMADVAFLVQVGRSHVTLENDLITFVA